MGDPRDYTCSHIIYTEDHKIKHRTPDMRLNLISLRNEVPWSAHAEITLQNSTAFTYNTNASLKKILVSSIISIL